MWQYFKWACADYSLYNPLIQVARIKFEESDSEPLPSDYVAIRSVEAPQGRFLQEAIHRQGRRYQTIGLLPVRIGERPTTFWAGQGRLFLNKAITETVILTYDALHQSPANFEDDAFELTIPPSDERAITLFIRAQFAGQVRAKTANLDRFKDKSEAGNTRLDNPMIPEHETLMREYYRILYEKYSPGGAVPLYRPGKSS